MRRLENYVRKYGPVAGPKLYHALQSQAAHAGVSARLRRKIDLLTGRVTAVAVVPREDLPLFPEAPEQGLEGTGSPAFEAVELMAVGG